ncbi:MAG: WYL domain-containing protein, partial [Burkholderiaceae bacterium]
LPPLMFSEDEVLALGLGLVAVRQLGLAEAAPAVASAQAKLERVLPPALKQRQRGIAERVALDLQSTSEPAAIPGAALATLGTAALAQQRVALHYRDMQGRLSERPFDPYCLGFRGGCWYAVGHCGLRRALRSFRVDRIVSAAPLPQSFGRPAGFDVLAHLAESMAAIPRAHTVQALVQAPLAALMRQPLAALSTLEQQAGGVLLRCQADELDWMARSFAALPFPFQILAPDALNDELKRVAERLLAAGAPQSS